MLKEMLIAGCGGFAGTAGRYLVGRIVSAVWHGSMPLGTLAVNVLGCLLFGLFFGLLENSRLTTSAQSLLLITGFCGGFTTFSAFAGDMWNLALKGDWASFALYLSLSIASGILCVWAGRALVRVLSQA
ncbi:MAG: CrcB family protein [Duncaniella sp.]|nr:CrcB family protein [Duncaniella sp.]